METCNLVKYILAQYLLISLDLLRIQSFCKGYPLVHCKSYSKQYDKK